MLRTLIASLTVAAVVGIGAVGIALANHDDDKNFPGYQCKAKKDSQTGNFQYSGGSIKNVTNATRKVVCPLVRDNLLGTTNALDFVRVSFKIDAAAVTLGQSLDCTVEVRDITNSSIFDSATLSETVAGNGNLFFFSLDYSTGQDDSVSVECKVPAKSRIRSVTWSEVLPTDPN